MANKQIIDYLNQNKDKYNPKTLYNELLKAGYPKKLIQQGINEVFIDKKASQSFWSKLKTKKIYSSKGQKIGHFFIGFFIIGIAFMIIYITLLQIPILHLFPIPIYSGLTIALFIYLISYRRWMGWGFIAINVLILTYIWLILWADWLLNHYDIIL